jgi:hypothetical protein
MSFRKVGASRSGLNYHNGKIFWNNVAFSIKKAYVVLGIFIAWSVMVLFLTGVFIQFLKELTKR